MEVSSDRTKELCEDVYFAIALAVMGEMNSDTRISSTIRIDPLRGVQPTCRFESGIRGSNIKIKGYQLSSTECERLEKYLQLVSVQNTEPIKMARTRLISAVIDRSLHGAGAQDSLVDAVIGLENLFGGGAEISFSLATGVSKLLGQSPGERNRIFNETKKVYGARSRVVHGELKPTGRYKSTCVGDFLT